MKLVGLMMVRNEEWIIGTSVRAAIRWCDHLVVMLDRCTDSTRELAEMAGYKTKQVTLMNSDVAYDAPWDEMDVRQNHLEEGRRLGGTHFAIVDGDEILTHNQLPHVRNWFKNAAPEQCIDVPMVAVSRDPGHHRTDNPWGSASLTLGFRDSKRLYWRAAGDGYQHHARAPKGELPNRMVPLERGQGGVMHVQFMNLRRLVAKHVLYRMVDHLRWPGRRTVEQLNFIYDQALADPGELSEVPSEWWGDYDGDIDTTCKPWQEDEVKRLLREHGAAKFEGLNLYGMEAL